MIRRSLRRIRGMRFRGATTGVHVQVGIPDWGEDGCEGTADGVLVRRRFAGLGISGGFEEIAGDSEVSGSWGDRGYVSAGGDVLRWGVTVAGNGRLSGIRYKGQGCTQTLVEQYSYTVQHVSIEEFHRGHEGIDPVLIEVRRASKWWLASLANPRRSGPL